MRDDRPDYVHCIRQPFADERRHRTMCGEPVEGWVFDGADHALAVAMNAGRQLACTNCVRICSTLLERHSEERGGLDEAVRIDSPREALLLWEPARPTPPAYEWDLGGD